jgi:hypothetical protein
METAIEYGRFAYSGLVTCIGGASNARDMLWALCSESL